MQTQMTNLQLLLLVAIAAAAPCLYAQCVSKGPCLLVGPPGSGMCLGPDPMPYSPAEDAYWLAGSFTCGILVINGQSYGPCGVNIATECA